VSIQKKKKKRSSLIQETNMRFLSI
jgi:hypothetical protein